MLPHKPFYLIRHGESEANAAEISAGGGLDSPLTEKGRGQPQALAPFLTDLEIKPDIIYHSPMIRARDTATFLNEHIQLEMIADRELREHEIGELEGKPWSECDHYFAERKPFPGGECHQTFTERVQRTITKIVDNEPGLPMLVAHGGLFHAISNMYEYNVRMSVANCHLHYFEPEAAFGNMPFRIYHFDVIDGKLEKIASPFCESHTMSDVA